jgi:hypothetical protein
MPPRKVVGLLCDETDQLAFQLSMPMQLFLHRLEHVHAKSHSNRKMARHLDHLLDVYEAERKRPVGRRPVLRMK